MYKNGSFKFSAAIEEKIEELNTSEKDVSGLVYDFAVSDYFNYAKQKGPINVWKENVENSLTRLIDICRKQKIDLVIIRLYARLPIDIDDKELLNNFLAKQKISYFDVSNYFPFEIDELRVADGHLSAKGYDLLSSKVLELLIQTNKININ